MRRIAISDIHACSQTFRHLIENRVQLKFGDQLFLLGDYFNRGPDPWGVFDFIWQLEARGVKVLCLRGNHEDRFMAAYERGEIQAERRYVDYVRRMPNYHEVDGYLLVHAGFNFLGGDPMEDTYAMRWIRDWEQNIDLNWLGNRQIIHGHIRRSYTEILAAVRQRRPIIGIDCGCFAVEDPGQGQLCAFDLDRNQVIFQPNLDMVKERV